MAQKVKKLLILMVFMVIFCAAGCQPQNPSIVELNSCTLPCWNESNAGVTTIDEFQIILRTLLFVDQSSLDTGGGWQFFDERVYFRFTDSEVHGVGYFIEDKLVKLTLDGDLNTTIQMIVDQVGYPDYIINVPLSGGMPGAPTSSNAITAIYPELGFSFTYDTRDLPKKMRAEFSSDIPVDVVSIFDPGIYDQLIESGLFGQSLLSGEETLKYLRPWSGYGSIYEKYPPASY